MKFHPLEILQKAIMRLLLDSNLGPNNNVPGHVIKKMSKEDREVLSELTSDMTKNQRPPWK